MVEPATRAVLLALGQDGTPVRFVGGCVRDTLAGRPVKDIDIATPLPPEEVMRRLRAAGLGVVPTGLEHGTVTAISDHRPYEVTTLRRDVSTDGRRATVAFTEDWDEDAARRDLTFNALSLEPDGTLHDPFDGLADLERGRVRFIGDPHRRIVEDRLRILRFFRFLAWYGREEPAPDQIAACRDHAPEIARLSGERVRTELLRLLAAPDPVPTLRLMAGAGVLGEVLPPGVVPDLAALERMVGADRSLGLEPDGLLRLAALLPIDAAVVEEIAGRLRLSGVERGRLKRAAARGAAIAPVVTAADARAWRRALDLHGVQGFRDLRRLEAADGANRAGADQAGADQAGADQAGAGGTSAGDLGELATALDMAARWSPPAFPISGHDVAALGIAPGPAMGRLLDAVRRWWVDEDFLPDRAACLDRLAMEAARRT